MQSIISRIDFVDKDHNQAVVHVQTNKTFYKVALAKDGGTILGPGVEESFDRNSLLTFEGEAIIAVVNFEEST